MRMKPVLDLARFLDIATNPEPYAIFESSSAGFQVWCTPQDHPLGWEGVQMIAGTFSKPCEYLGSVHWKWESEQIVALEIESSAYALAEQKPDEFCNLNEIPLGDKRRTIFNRGADIAWLQEKVTWLFEEAGIPLLPFDYEPAPLPQSEPFLLAHYVTDVDDYVVIVAPGIDPEEFCQPGYELADTIEVWEADDFPANVPLCPEYGDAEGDIEPDEGPLVEQFENASRLGEDGWLEADYEDRTSTFED
jgi:hypothetical protein